MTTPLDDWVISWRRILPVGDWIIYNDEGDRVGRIFMFENPKHDNDNKAQKLKS